MTMDPRNNHRVNPSMSFDYQDEIEPDFSFYSYRDLDLNRLIRSKDFMVKHVKTGAGSRRERN